MTDKEKLDKLVAEIERRKKMNILNENKYEEDIDLLSFYNSMQEESEYLEEETTYCAFSTSHYTDKERKALCKGCEEECEFKPTTSVWHDTKEEPQTDRQILLVMKNGNKKILTHYGCSEYCIDCVWVKLSEQNKWAYIDDLLKL